MRRYEALLIVPPEADESVLGGVADRIAQALAERSGQITKSDRWGKRRLAYPIGNLTEGFYLVVEFDAEPDAMKELDRVLALADEVVRHKILFRPMEARSEPKAGAA